MISKWSQHEWKSTSSYIFVDFHSCWVHLEITFGVTLKSLWDHSEVTLRSLGVWIYVDLCSLSKGIRTFIAHFVSILGNERKCFTLLGLPIVMILSFPTSHPPLTYSPQLVWSFWFGHTVTISYGCVFFAKSVISALCRFFFIGFVSLCWGSSSGSLFISLYYIWWLSITLLSIFMYEYRKSRALDRLGRV